MTASIHTIQSDLDKIIKPLLEKILEKLNEERTSTTEIVEAAAAKVISEMKNCHCNKEILEALSSQPKENENTVVLKTDGKERGPYLYSYPNFSVGNEELGTGKNSKSLSWPFGVDK